MSANLAVDPPSFGETLRRLSSHSVNKEALDIRSPTLVVPPKYLQFPGEAGETAAAIELARYNLEEPDSPELARSVSAESVVTDKYAFAFDIDGVLIRGGKPIPEAIEAMKVLNGKNSRGIKV